MYVFKERKPPEYAVKKDIAIIPDEKHFEIEVEDTFHLKHMYKHIHDWLQINNYFDPDTNNENFENLYLQRTQQNGLMFHHIWWRVVKNLDKGSGDKFQAFFKINFQTVAVSPHETMIDGKKFKTFKGDVILRIKAYLRIDQKDQWDKHPIIKHFQKIMIDRWLSKQIDQYKKEIYNDLLELQRQIKHYMGAKTGLPTEKQWNKGITGI